MAIPVAARIARIEPMAWTQEASSVLDNSVVMQRLDTKWGCSSGVFVLPNVANKRLDADGEAGCGKSG